MLKSYPQYRPSTIPWQSLLPEDWSTSRLRQVAQVRTSNVDKVTEEGELPVRLCNYVDVYRNDWVHLGLGFMKGSATADEVTKFRLKVNDIVITKDSEDWRDIGIPALVLEEAPDLVCGYHLAILRPTGISGAYLFRCLQSPTIATQWHVAATGVTRYGLSQVAIKALVLPVPPLQQQEMITRYLDGVDGALARLMSSKQREARLLREQRQAIVDTVVTSGLTPESGPSQAAPLAELPSIPAHWQTKPMKAFFREIDDRSADGSEELLSVSHLTGVSPRSEKNVTMFMAESYTGHKVCRPNDLVINTMWAWMGALGVSSRVGLVSPAYAVYRLRSEDLLSEYAEMVLTSRPYVAEYMRRSTGIRGSRLRLYPDVFLRIPMICPPLEEQKRIIDFVHRHTSELDRAVSTATTSTSKIKELRSALIDDVVLGRVDVQTNALLFAEQGAIELLATAFVDHDDLEAEEAEDLDVEEVMT